MMSAARLGAALIALVAFPASASAASISVTAPPSAARGAPLTLHASGVAPPNVSGAPAGDQASVDAWVQPLSDGACPAQEPLDAPAGAWGFNHGLEAVAAGAAFAESWNADSASERVGRYVVCVWTMDDRFNTAAAAQAPLALRPPVLRLSVSVPRHARVGTRGTFALSASLETQSRLGILLLPPRAYVCDASGERCRLRGLSRCPASYSQAENLAASIQASVTPFARAAFADPVHEFRGRVRFSARLKALSAGVFHFCAYAREDPFDGPRPFTEGHAFAAFGVAR